jgi:hypothetical protein
LFLDENVNGRRDAEEGPFAGGADFYLDLNNNGQHDGTEPGARAGQDGRFTIGGVAAGRYRMRFRRAAAVVNLSTFVPGDGLVVQLSPGQARPVEVGVYRPAARVSLTQFTYERLPLRLRVTMTDVSDAAPIRDGVRVEGPDGMRVAPDAVTFNSSAGILQLDFNRQLPNGNYVLVIPGPAMAGSSGLGTPADYRYGFFVLAGDINRDRAVNGTDFAILAANFGRAGRTYATGDLTGDGTVNGTDFAILAANFGKTAPAPAPPSPPPAQAAAAPPPTTIARREAPAARPGAVAPPAARPRRMRHPLRGAATTA